MATYMYIGSGNGLLPGGTKPLPEPGLTYHHSVSWHLLDDNCTNILMNLIRNTCTKILLLKLPPHPPGRVSLWATWLFEIRSWVCNYIQYITMGVIIYPLRIHLISHVSKTGPMRDHADEFLGKLMIINYNTVLSFMKNVSTTHVLSQHCHRWDLIMW